MYVYLNLGSIAMAIIKQKMESKTKTDRTSSIKPQNHTNIKNKKYVNMYEYGIKNKNYFKLYTFVFFILRP